MKYRIAVIEDDELILSMILLNLEKSGFSVRGYSSAEDVFQSYQTERFDVIILDIVLPEMSGEDFLKEIRRSGDSTPVLMLTAKDDIPTRIKTLNEGADDYMVKPFNLDELLARTRALIRRSQGERHLPASDTLVISKFRVHVSTRLSESNQGEVTLSEKEVRLLQYLSRHSDMNLSRADILEDIWGMDVAPTPRTIDNFILKFRKLYEDNPEKPKHFLSVRGQGYRFEN